METEVCRICPRKVGFFKSVVWKIVEVSNRSTTLAEVIDCLLPSINIFENDGYSDKICIRCSKKLLDFYEFKLNAEKNYLILASRNKTMNVVLTQDITHKPSLEERMLNLDNNFKETTEKMEIIDGSITNDAETNEDVVKVKEELDLSLNQSCLHHEINIYDSDGNFTIKLEQVNIVDKEVENQIATIQYDNQDNSHKEEIQCDETNLTVHSPIQEDKPFKGDQCNKKYVANHSIKDSFECEFCEKTFLQNHYLKGHLLLHFDKKLFKCDICQKTFKYQSCLKSHFLSHHKKTQIECEFCQKTFLQYSSLESHMLIHYDTKPIECEHCQKTFSTPTLLNRHLLIHSDKRDFNCPRCKKTFKYQAHLNAHFLIHLHKNPFKCDYCEKTFSQNHHLKSHLLQHFDKTSFKCDICQKTFRHQVSLKKHLLTH